MADLDDTMSQLAVANRILAREDVVDAFGHVSVRHPNRPECFLLARSRSPELVGRDDLLEFGPDGEPVNDNGPVPYAERFIHAGIFAARPDVQSVVHTHAEPLLPFGITGTPLKPVHHLGSRIGHVVPLWDIRDSFGDATDLLVTNMDHGRDLAEGLGGNRMVLMRGHGNAVATESLENAVLTAIYAQVNARVQTASMMMALARGKGMEAVNALTDDEISASRGLGKKGSLGGSRSWEYFERRADMAGV